MPRSNKKRSRNEEEDDAPDWQNGEGSGNQILPVAILPADFDGVPLDGSQYLAVVRKEARAAPSIARYKEYASMEAKLEDKELGIEDADLLPPQEWRDSFLHKFKNMRESLRSRVQSGDQPHKVDNFPKGKSAKKWFKYLHGSEPSIKEYSEDEEEQVENNESLQSNSNSKGGNLRVPKDSLLRSFHTEHIMVLLQSFTIWLDENWYKPKEEPGKAVQPAIYSFHSQWLFALLAHLDERLVGDDISILRQLARSCICRIAHSRSQRKTKDEGLIDMENEQGCWIIICVIAGVWGQYDLLDDARTALRQPLSVPH
ncbi:uncharacterized protein FA14DRAFT_190843 [Meira miltonrushii]|uniref:Gem-associated protein 2 n=1 Tax=Meira miltonrushii TaxID=1280837 RepID=A0A316V890_9BASI|nr:uncharacterized protein FA14DRAFT_190843 [Meira miltonrushii]PWN33716.1 hypothetical protein FA14DRAFT_190843 [Meira miltonrushii]